MTVHIAPRCPITCFIQSICLCYSRFSAMVFIMLILPRAVSRIRFSAYSAVIRFSGTALSTNTSLTTRSNCYLLVSANVAASLRCNVNWVNRSSLKYFLARLIPSGLSSTQVNSGVSFNSSTSMVATLPAPKPGINTLFGFRFLT